MNVKNSGGSVRPSRRLIVKIEGFKWHGKSGGQAIGTHST